jgi:RNA polymerase sigma factor (sigma-70 family)
MGLRAARLLPDARLAQLAAGGDERAFEVLYDRHHRALLGFCRHMVGSPDEAEDALQQTFLRAHRALLAHGAPDDPRPWLFAIARNRCKTLLAARRVDAEVDERLPAAAGLAEEVQARADLRAVVEDVARLPDDQRAALVLAELADLSHAQIGEVIGVRAEKVKALVHQARTTLIAELAAARGGALRRAPLRRHLRRCAPCRAYRDAVAAQRRTLAAVLPVAPSAGLKAGILGAATGGGGAGLGAGLATKLAASAIVVGGATGGGVAIVDAPKPPTPRPPAAKAAAPAATRTAVAPRPGAALGERPAARSRVQRKRRGRERARVRRRHAAARRARAPARRNAKRAVRRPPRSRGRGAAAKPAKIHMAPRAPRSPAQRPHRARRGKR